MTDEEIKMALEYCCGSIQNDCRDCPFGERCENDESLLKYSLDLIKRQKAEIDRLQKEKAKIHKFIPKMIKEAKSEAVKEFAERLKKCTLCFDDYDEYKIKPDSVDNLVKEMAGE